MTSPPPMADQTAPISRTILGVLLVATIALILLGLVQPTPVLKATGHVDVDLYARFIDFAHHPSTFYASVMEEQRRQHYPLYPFITVRPPTLAFLLAALPNEFARRLVIQLLGVGVMAAWALRLGRLGVGPVWFGLALLALATGVVPACVGRGYLFQESWSGLLIALSLALRDPRRWGASLAFGLAAALIRELAAPYLVVMAVSALVEGRRREATAWLGSLALFAVALALHAWMVAQNVRPTDMHSQGWAHLSGLSFLLSASAWNLILTDQPQAWTAVAAPLALFGAVIWGGQTGRRVGLTVIGFLVGFIFVGRPENFYWGLLVAPLLPLVLVMGLSLTPGLARRLWFEDRAPGG